MQKYQNTGSVSEDAEDIGEDIEETDARQTSYQHDSEREGKYADGDGDLDDFIAEEGEVEYIENDPNDVINVHESDEDDQEEQHDDQDAVLAFQSRDLVDGFNIYVHYLQDCLLDPDLENRMHRKPELAQHMLYQQAYHHVRLFQ